MFNRCCQVTIGGEQKGSVKTIIKSVRQELNSYVYIGHLFLIIHPPIFTLTALPGLIEIVTIMHDNLRTRIDSIQVVRLTLYVGNITAKSTDLRCKIMYSSQILIRLQK